jgi:V8-like Glu-specific endopeptidase
MEFHWNRPFIPREIRTIVYILFCEGILFSKEGKMKKRFEGLRIILIIGILFGCGKNSSINLNEEPNLKEGGVIYGEDGREEVDLEGDTGLRELAVSTAVQIPKNLISFEGEVANIDSTPLHKKANICPEERFSRQSAAGRCSGFIISKDILVTAGHCVRKEQDCSGNYWVFDYKTSDPEGRISTIPSNVVYSCKKILATALDNGRGIDYAVIQLDREVGDRHPLRIRESGKVGETASLVVIGNPSGLPTKITSGGKIRENQNEIYFVASLDTFQGNSGSAVINKYSGEVEGILVRGDTDFKYDYSRNCNVHNYCTEEGCRGEDVTRIRAIPKVNDYLTGDGFEGIDERDIQLDFKKKDLSIPIEDFKVSQYSFIVEKDKQLKEVEVGVDIEHTYMGDLIIGIMHPDGTIIVLQNQEGGGRVNLKKSFLTKEFIGKRSKGTWKILIKDNAKMDQGKLKEIFFKG